MLAAVVLAALPQPASAQGASDVVTVEIEIVEVGLGGRNWGSIDTDADATCSEIARVVDGSTVTTRTECVGGSDFLFVDLDPADGSPGIALSGACDGTDPRAYDGTFRVSPDSSGREECRFVAYLGEVLDLTVASDSRVQPIRRLGALFRRADGSEFTAVEYCFSYGTAPVYEVPSLSLGNSLGCRIPAGPWTGFSTPGLPRVQTTLQCDAEDARDGEPVVVGENGVEIVVGSWSVEITQNGRSVPFNIRAESGGDCSAAGLCYSDGLVFGPYQVALVGPDGEVTATVGDGRVRSTVGRATTMIIEPGETNNIAFVVDGPPAVAVPSRLDIIVASGSRMQPTGDLGTRVVRPDGSSFDPADECIFQDAAPIEEIPQLLFGAIHECTVPSGTYSIAPDPILPRGTATLQCSDGDAREATRVPVGADGLAIDIGPEAGEHDECLMFFRGVDGELMVTIDAPSGEFDATAWRVEVTRAGQPLQFAQTADSGGPCATDGTCYAAEVAFGEYVVTLSGPPGDVTSTGGSDPMELPGSRTVTVQVGQGVTNGVAFAVEGDTPTPTTDPPAPENPPPELPATGRSVLPGVLGGVFVVIGLSLVASTRRRAV